MYDFIIPELGRDTPYGIYDMARNSGWVNVGTDHDTAAFAVASICRLDRSSRGCSAGFLVADKRLTSIASSPFLATS